MARWGEIPLQNLLCSTYAPRTERGSMVEEAGRRRYPRYIVHVPFFYAPDVPWPAVLGAGWTRSLSEGGATVEVATRLRPGTPLRLLINAVRAPIEVEARTVWSGGRSADVGGVVHGLTFDPMTPAQVQIVREMFHPPAFKRHSGIRIPLNVPVLCQPTHASGPPLHGRTENVSRSGFFLRLPDLVPPATALRVSLFAATTPSPWKAQSSGWNRRRSGSPVTRSDTAFNSPPSIGRRSCHSASCSSSFLRKPSASKILCCGGSCRRRVVWLQAEDAKAQGSGNGGGV